MAKPEVDPFCKAFQDAIDVLGRPWTALVLSMLQAGPMRFSEIEAGAPGVSPKTLSTRLKDLEVRGLVFREVTAGPPVRIVYDLTKSGRAFGDVAAAIERWGRTFPVRRK